MLEDLSRWRLIGLDTSMSRWTFIAQVKRRDFAHFNACVKTKHKLRYVLYSELFGKSLIRGGRGGGGGATQHTTSQSTFSSNCARHFSSVAFLIF